MDLLPGGFVKKEGDFNHNLSKGMSPEAPVAPSATKQTQLRPHYEYSRIATNRSRLPNVLFVNVGALFIPTLGRGGQKNGPNPRAMKIFSQTAASTRAAGCPSQNRSGIDG